MGVVLLILLPAIAVVVILLSLDTIVYGVVSFTRWMRNLFEVDPR